GVGGSIGLGDAWALRANINYAINPASDPLHVVLGGLEAVYVLDIARIIPFFGLGVDVIGTVFQSEFGMEFGAHAILGVDYLVDREFLLGLDIRPYILFASALEDGRLDPAYLAVQLRAEWRYDL
ncbi:MAG: hypothetical protein AAGF12_10850, partial [Myxococcota bacterium]